MSSIQPLTPMQLRDFGLALVKYNSGSWFYQALALIEALPASWTGTSEDIRLGIFDPMIGPGHVPNVYGSVTRYAIQCRLLTRTGGRRHMRGPKSNARTTDVYVRTGMALPGTVTQSRKFKRSLRGL